ncbi:MAG: hypothetical protein GKC10_09845 [Methanosarcinales archaeon]|nr:hypothetical protein [Methanosarcinales archaeon]
MAVDLGEIGAASASISHKAELQPGDQGWFKLNVIESTRLMIAANADIDADNYGMVLYDADMKYMDSVKDMLMADLSPGIYYIRLDMLPHEAMDYTLIVSNIFETEPNDGLLEAFDLGMLSDSVVVGGFIEPVGDIDFFKFEVPEDGSGLLTVSTTDSKDDYSDKPMVVLYNLNESTGLYVPRTTGEKLSSLIQPGLYYVRVQEYGSQDDAFNYTLSLDIEPIVCDVEPNDSFENSSFIGDLNESGKLSASGCIGMGDMDYFSFQVPANMTVGIKTITDGDSSIVLYDSEMEEVDYNDDCEGKMSSCLESELTAGMYYVTVKCYYEEKEMGYELAIEAVE